MTDVSLEIEQNIHDVTQNNDICLLISPFDYLCFSKYSFFFTIAMSMSMSNIIPPLEEAYKLIKESVQRKTVELNICKQRNNHIVL